MHDLPAVRAPPICVEAAPNTNVTVAVAAQVPVHAARLAWLVNVLKYETHITG